MTKVTVAKPISIIEKRKEKNRQLAQRSRDRHKAFIQSLQEANSEKDAQIKQLKNQLNALTIKNVLLEAEIFELKEARPAFNPDAPTESMADVRGAAPAVEIKTTASTADTLLPEKKPVPNSPIDRPWSPGFLFSFDMSSCENKSILTTPPNSPLFPMN